MLDDLIDSWLNAPPHKGLLRFPDRLEARFEADTGAERCRTLMVFGAFGFLFGTLLFPVLQSMLPDVQPLTRTLYLETSMPFGFAVAGAMWFRPPPFWREGLTLAANLVCICVTMYLVSISRGTFLPFAAAGVVVLMVYSAIGVQLRFYHALVALIVIVVTYGMALDARDDITRVNKLDLVVIAAVTASYLMLANWRMEREIRRSYLLVLRERLQRQDLSLRNLELDELARRDPLTGLANRRAYDAWLSAAWTQEGETERGGRGRLGLIVIDVDRFKAFNDFYGHAAGDSCLKKIAVCLREQLRGTTDLVARLGGEEFAVLLPGLPESVCADVAERMRMAVQRLELPHSGIGPHGLVSVSAGVASYPIVPATSPSALFEAADSALYEAKVSGRNRVCVATMFGVTEAVAN